MGKSPPKIIKKDYPTFLKMKIVKEAEDYKNTKKISRKYHICPKNIRQWKLKRKYYEELINKLKEMETYNSKNLKLDECELINFILSSKTKKTIKQLLEYLNNNMVDFKDKNRDIQKEWIINVIVKNFDKVKDYLEINLCEKCKKQYEFELDVDKYEKEFKENEAYCELIKKKTRKLDDDINCKNKKFLKGKKLTVNDNGKCDLNKSIINNKKAAFIITNDEIKIAYNYKIIKRRKIKDIIDNGKINNYVQNSGKLDINTLNEMKEMLIDFVNEG